ncbi:unnamed protein product [Aphanomyces euteiches]|uniref:TauD/TfdA-like domain-containing protein n=1 Tax=Aphanomyces euteiches TaxID=100861 RepID=A0A6G0X5P8_9STRA|nr:hypothetical protein Ae201684_008185 [Aphanomyces euteiches]KAH9070454.1 hypothetical protein Ae201684P_002812 [Aphanomyces euteiches]KAH9136324.1 hypothetical protein AeRB84_018467 [Aphanomyces euteiches]
MLTSLFRRHKASKRFFSTIASAGAQQDKLHVAWSDGHSTNFDLVHLRAWCTCPQCQHSTGQRLVNISDTPVAPRIDKIHVDSENVQIEWATGPQADTEPHSSLFTSSEMRKMCYDPESLRASVATPPALSATESVSSVEFDALSSDKGVLELCRHILRDGLAIVRNVPSVPGNVANVAETIAPLSHTHLYGTVFDVVAEHNPVNIAYTNERLKLHMDLAYYESPPGLQLLHALRYDPSVQGGNSTFRDTFEAAETLRTRFPEHFKTLTRVPATFKKFHLERKKPAILEYSRPHIALNHDGEVTGVFWSPPFEGPLRVAAEDIAPYYAAYREFDKIVNENVIEFKLNQGDLVIFNQRRMLHGREAFSAGSDGVRHLQGTYVNIDDFLCRYQALQHQATGLPSTLLRVGNKSF